ncbi:MAG: hypothetical protein JW991_04740 [Candidatus Pacebacteria bacterium]|nr:hypothetical protein [Candidatus Paceibacterota bacterium]
MSYYPEKINGFSLDFFRSRPCLSGYAGLYLSSAFRSLGMSLIGLFIPLYILKLTGHIVYVFLFFALYHFWVIVSDYPVAWLVRKWGIDWLSFLGSLARAGFIFLFLQAEAQPVFLWPATFLWGLTVTATWLPFHYAFTIAENMDGKYGREVSQLQIVNKITGLAGPLAGGVIIASLGFRPLFALALVLIAISGLPLFFDTINAKGMRLSFKKIKGHLFRKDRSRFWLSFAGGELETAVLGLAWPLFIFLLVESYETLGLIKSLAALVSVALFWFVGRWIDKKGKSILYLGTLINSFNILLRAFLSNPFGLFLVDSVYDFTAGLVTTPFDSAFYEKAREMRRLEFMVEREFIIHFFGMLACLLLSLLFLFEVAWFWIFALGVVGVLMRGLIISQEEEPWWQKVKRRILGR